MFTAEQIAALSAPLSRENVSTRQGAGRMNLSYVESHLVIREANRIFGFDGWSSETVDLRVTTEKAGDQHNVSYMARVRITVYAGDRTIVREGVGAGHGRDRDAGQAHEKAAKEAESDAQKRALRQFGDQFGLALYDKAQEHVADAPPVSPKPAQETPAQERPSKPSAPSSKQPEEDWKVRERAKVSAAVAANLLDGNAALVGLRTLYKALGSPTPLSRTLEDYATWDKQKKQVWRQLTVADQQMVTKAVNKFEDALREATARERAEEAA